MNTKGDDTNQNSDMGPARKQALDPMNNGDHIEAFGYIDTGGHANLSKEDSNINKTLREAVGKMQNQKAVTVDWPAVSDHAVCEYGDTKTFALAFPWLFPGGIGDVKDFPGTITDWGKMMLFYQDG